MGFDYLGEVLVAGLGLDVADEVAVVAVVGGVQQPKVVPALLAVELDTEEKYPLCSEFSDSGKCYYVSS